MSLWFWYAFPRRLVMLSIFWCACWQSAFPLWKNVYSVLLPIFKSGYLFDFLLLSCMNCLYMLDINPLSVISFANIFSHSIGCLFNLSMVSFVVQKLLSLIRSHLFIFAFISFVLGDRSKKILLWFMSKITLFHLCSLLVLWFQVLYLGF